MGKGECELLGTALPFIHGPHEINQHGGERCMPARIEVVALAAHMLHVRPSELDEVKRRMMDHLRGGCTCGEGREFET